MGLPLAMVAAVAPRGRHRGGLLIVTLAVLAPDLHPGPVVETALSIWAWPLFILVFMASRAAAAIDDRRPHPP